MTLVDYVLAAGERKQFYSARSRDHDGEQYHSTKQVHSHALAASALHTPLNCHPTPTPVSLNASLSSIALALPSTTSRCLTTETAGLVSYKH
jgi:hypothetical protein